jgi:hypothetical protein
MAQESLGSTYNGSLCNGTQIVSNIHLLYLFMCNINRIFFTMLLLTYSVGVQECLGNTYNGSLCNGTEIVHATGLMSAVTLERCDPTLISQDVLIRWFKEVSSPTKSSTYCLKLLIKTTS